MRVVKSVSLPVDLAKKAEEFENFSVFVADAIKHGVEENIQHQYAMMNGYRNRSLTYKALIQELLAVIRVHGSTKVKHNAYECIYNTGVLGEELLERDR